MSRDLLTPADIGAELDRLLKVLDEANDQLVLATREFSDAALHYANSEEEVARRNNDLPPTKLSTIVHAETAVAKAKRQIAECNRSDAMTQVVNVRAQMSALQTLAKLVIGEMDMAGKYET